MDANHCCQSVELFDVDGRTILVGAFITFLILYGLYFAVERNQTEVDGYNIATVAGVPVR